MAIPTCVQHVKWSNSNESGNAFVLKLVKENSTLASNCLLLALYYPSGATLSSIVETNAGTPNTWSTTPIATATDGGNLVTVAWFVVYGANAGATAFTVTFSAAVAGFSASFSEWYNVATSAALDVQTTNSVTLSSATVNSITSGEVTTTVAGDLILHLAWDSDNGPGGSNGSGFINGLRYLTKQTPGFKFLQADLTAGYFLEYWVQPQLGGTNPAVTTLQNSYPSTWESLTIALKSASAGTAPSSTAQRIFGVQEMSLQGNGLTTGNVVPVQFPTVGNQLVICCDDPASSISITAVSGAISGSWTVVSSSGADAQGAHKESALSGDGEILSVTLNDPSAHGYCFVHIYDTVHGGKFDTSQHTDTSTTFGPGNSNPTVSFTPGVSAGYVYTVAGINTGPPDSLVSPAGTLLSPTYTSQTDFSGLSNGDLHATFQFVSNAAQTWQFHNTVSTTGYSMLNMSFSLGPIITSPPVNQRAPPGKAVTFSVSATASSGSLSYQWYRIAPGNAPYSAGSSVSGATSSTYTFTPNYPTDYGAMWYCAVTDSNATVNSGTPAQVLFNTEQFGKHRRPLVNYDDGSQDYKSELTIKRWF